LKLVVSTPGVPSTSRREGVNVRCFEPFARSAQRARLGVRVMNSSTSAAAATEAGSRSAPTVSGRMRSGDPAATVVSEWALVPKSRRIGANPPVFVEPHGSAGAAVFGLF
jgi:hypothetical protein